MSGRSTVSFLVASLILLVEIGNRSVQGDEADLAAGVRQILADGWTSPVTGMNAARAHHQRVALLAPADSRPGFAMVLVYLKYHRAKEAAALLDQLLADHPKHAAALKARAWLAASNKDFAASLTVMESLAAVLADPKTPLDQTERDELAQFLGSLFGYLEGPVSSSVDEGLLRESEQRIVALLTDPPRSAFTLGCRDLAGQFAELAGLGVSTRQEERETARQQQQQDQERLADEKTDLLDEKASLEDTAAKVRGEAESSVSDIDKKLDPLNRRLAQLTADGRLVQGRIAAVDAEIGRLQSQINSAGGDENANFRFQLRNQIGILGRQYDLLVRDFRILDAEATRVNIERGTLLGRRAAIIAAYEAEMKRLGVKYKGLTGQEARIDRQKSQATEPVTGNTARVRALAARLTALPTYLAYPLELEKKRLLDSLR